MHFSSFNGLSIPNYKDGSSKIIIVINRILYFIFIDLISFGNKASEFYANGRL